MDEKWNEFYQKASLLGHDLKALRQGQEIITYGTFSSLPEGRQLLSVAIPSQRIARQEFFFNPPLLARQRLGQGKHDRGEAILFANGSFLEGDYQGVGNHLPARIKAVSILKKRVLKGETWDVSVRGEIWGVDDLEELYTTVNVGELILEPGAKIIVRGNVFSLLCQRLVCLESANKKASEFQIGILPTPFSVDTKNGPMDGQSGKNGLHGESGKNGIKAQTANSIFGRTLIKPITYEEMSATDGSSGENGSKGENGRNGGMCKIAELTLRNIEGEVSVFVQAGTGGNGGNGGKGGNGGNGGIGAAGCNIIRKIEGKDGPELIETTLKDGQNGRYGNGGNGGKGGHGGNGGLASNVYINVPLGKEDKVNCTSLPSKGGKGGNGGEGGVNGNGMPMQEIIRKGKSGLSGRNGRNRPAAWVFLNEQPLNSELINKNFVQNNLK